MTPEDAEEFTRGLGLIGEGWWRQIAWADRRGIPAALGMTTRQWVENRLGGYIRLAVADRREAVAELTDDGMSTRQVGEVLGVHHSTVGRDVGANAPVMETEPQVTPSADGANAPEGEPAGPDEDTLAELRPMVTRMWANEWFGEVERHLDELERLLSADAPTLGGRVTSASAHRRAEDIAERCHTAADRLLSIVEEVSA